MSAREWIVLALVGPAVALTVVCALGALVMRDPFQRLHFISPPATLSAFAIAIAAFVDGPGKQPGGKAVIVALVLTVMNGLATHATARAIWVRAQGRWSADPDRGKAVIAHSLARDDWEDAP